MAPNDPTWSGTCLFLCSQCDYFYPCSLSSSHAGFSLLLYKTMLHLPLMWPSYHLFLLNGLLSVFSSMWKHPFVIHTWGLLWPANQNGSQSHWNISSCLVFLAAFITAGYFWHMFVCMLLLLLLKEYKPHEYKILLGSHSLVYSTWFTVPRTGSGM